MKAFVRVLGWILILGGIAGLGFVIYLAVSGRTPGGFLNVLLLGAPAVLVMIIGAAMTRVGRRKADTTFGEADAQWTRRNLR